MATRLYLTNSTTPYTPATIRGSWDSTTSAITQYLGPAAGGAAATRAQAETSTSSTFDVLLGRWVSDGAVAAGTLSGTLAYCYGAFATHFSSSPGNLRPYFHVYVTTGDSDTPRGTILSNYVDTSQLYPDNNTNTPSGVGLADISLTSLSIQAGDRLVVELGFRATNTTSSSRTGTMNYGNTGGRDLAKGSTSVTASPGWVQFSDPSSLFRTLSANEKNLCPNPAAGSGVGSNWQGSNYTGTATTVTGFSRSTGLHFTASSTAYSSGFPPQAPASSGEVFSAYVEFKCSASRAGQVYLNFRDITGNFISSVNPVNNVTFGAWQSSKHENYTAPAGTVAVDITVESANIVNGDTLDMSCARYDWATSISAYKDGDSSGWAWDGTAEVSTSHLSATNTTANAGNAAVTPSAPTPTTAIAPTGGAGTGTVTAPSPAPSIAPAATSGGANIGAQSPSASVTALVGCAGASIGAPSSAPGVAPIAAATVISAAAQLPATATTLAAGASGATAAAQTAASVIAAPLGVGTATVAGQVAHGNVSPSSGLTATNATGYSPSPAMVPTVPTAGGSAAAQPVTGRVSSPAATATAASSATANSAISTPAATAASGATASTAAAGIAAAAGIGQATTTANQLTSTNTTTAPTANTTTVNPATPGNVAVAPPTTGAAANAAEPASTVTATTGTTAVAATTPPPLPSVAAPAGRSSATVGTASSPDIATRAPASSANTIASDMASGSVNTQIIEASTEATTSAAAAVTATASIVSVTATTEDLSAIAAPTAASAGTATASSPPLAPAVAIQAPVAVGAAAAFTATGLVFPQPGTAPVNAAGLDALPSNEHNVFAQIQAARTDVSAPNISATVIGSAATATGAGSCPAVELDAQPGVASGVAAAGSLPPGTAIASHPYATTGSADCPTAAPTVAVHPGATRAACAASAVVGTGQSFAPAPPATSQVVAGSASADVLTRVSTTQIGASVPVSTSSVAPQARLAGVLTETLGILAKATFTWPPTATSVVLVGVATAVVDIAAVATATVVLENAADAEHDIEQVARGYPELVLTASATVGLK